VENNHTATTTVNEKNSVVDLKCSELSHGPARKLSMKRDSMNAPWPPKEIFLPPKYSGTMSERKETSRKRSSKKLGLLT
jgi:hypothetical protein